MLRRRRHKTKNAHYCILVNPQAMGYQQKLVDKLITAVRKSDAYFSLYEPTTAMDLLKQAQVAAGQRRASRSHPAPDNRRGKVTALIAAGGDGTLNLVARAAKKADLPLGVLPMGCFNNIARYLCRSSETEAAINKIIEGKYRKIDTATVSNQLFVGSIGLGFIPQLAALLEERGNPRFALGWSQLGARAAANTRQVKTLLKIDAFRFEVSTRIININLMPYSLGLPFSPASIADDGHAEIIFDQGDFTGDFSAYTRLIYKRKYIYGDDIRIYRGQDISIQPTQGRRLYLDGEIIELPSNTIEIKSEKGSLKVFC